MLLILIEGMNKILVPPYNYINCIFNTLQLRLVAYLQEGWGSEWLTLWNWVWWDESVTGSAHNHAAGLIDGVSRWGWEDDWSCWRKLFKFYLLHQIEVRKTNRDHDVHLAWPLEQVLHFRRKHLVPRNHHSRHWIRIHSWCRRKHHRRTDQRRRRLTCTRPNKRSSENSESAISDCHRTENWKIALYCSSGLVE